jgi:hypothetical protein
VRTVSVAHDKLVWRVRTAMAMISPEHLTLDELCWLVPIVEAAADREAIGSVDDANVITFAACRRRRARRLASRKQSGAGD